MTQFDGCIEALSPAHERRGFSCGEADLDDYLRRFARQHAETRISRTYVAARDGVVLGYYSLSMAAIRRDHLPARHRNSFPNYPVPVARLARLAVDRHQQGGGLGGLLLSDALYRCLRLSEEIGAVGVVVDAKHERARSFYLRFEFEVFPETPLTLWLPMAAIAGLFPATEEGKS